MAPETLGRLISAPLSRRHNTVWGDIKHSCTILAKTQKHQTQSGHRGNSISNRGAALSYKHKTGLVRICSRFCDRSDRQRAAPSVPWRPPRPHWTRAGPDHGGALSARSQPASESVAEGQTLVTGQQHRRVTTTAGVEPTAVSPSLLQMLTSALYSRSLPMHFFCLGE